MNPITIAMIAVSFAHGMDFVGRAQRALSRYMLVQAALAALR
jgi:hypothetical protein